jgi:transmembrane sensor
MTNRYGISDEPAGRLEAADWLARADRGALSPEEALEFQDWLAEPANARAYERARRTWAIFDDCAGDQHIRALRKAAEDAGRDAARLRRIKGMAIAAAACLALMVGGTVLMSRPDAPTVVASGADDGAAAPQETVTQSYSTRKGERLSVVLADNTAVTLNTDTQIDVDYTPGERRVHLVRGQAFFEVAKNPNRPFVVAAADRRVVALGTQFDVRLAPGQFQVLLVEGRVAVQRDHTLSVERESPPPQEVILHPGQKLTASLGLAEQVSEVDVDRQLMWRTGFVEFDDVLLEAAVAEMNRYSRDPVVIRDPRVAALRVSGVFRTGQLDRFLETVSELLPVAVDRDAGRKIELTWSGT